MTGAVPMALVVAAVFGAFGLSAAQAAIASRAGSDHPVHAFLRDGIRANGGRLFVTVPRLLNTAHCAALPLYLHWIMARLPVGAIRWSERLLNPMINAGHTLLVGAISAVAAAASGLPATHAAWIALLFALTPQFFHAVSARNFGLSARGVGLVLLTAFFACAYQTGTATSEPAWWIAVAVLAWLIWGFSTFAQQALVILSLLLLLGGLWRPAVGAGLGLILFVALHRPYSLSYLRHTLRFLRAYARELAPIYVLQRRPSIWRDLVSDLWRKPGEVGVQRALLYAYENPVVVVLLLNPLAWVAVLRWASGAAPAGWYACAGALAAAGMVAALLTSFRATRFLGEPERYVEAVSPWATLCGAQAIAHDQGEVALIALAAAFALFNIAQLAASWLLMRHAQPTSSELDDIARAVQSHCGDDVRFCSNNEQLTKLMMGHHWRFAYFIAVGQDYAGMTATEAFTRFPFLSRDGCTRVVRAYRVNCLLIDRAVFESPFDAPPQDLEFSQTLYESGRFRLLRLQWSDRQEHATGHAPKAA